MPANALPRAMSVPGMCLTGHVRGRVTTGALNSVYTSNTSYTAMTHSIAAALYYGPAALWPPVLGELHPQRLERRQLPPRQDVFPPGERRRAAQSLGGQSGGGGRAAGEGRQRR